MAGRPRTITLHVFERWSSQLEAACSTIDGESVEIFQYLPIIAIVDADARPLPGEVHRQRVSRDLYGVVGGIDLVLREASCLAGTVSANGNRWAARWDAATGYPVVRQTAEAIRVVGDTSLSLRTPTGIPLILSLSLAFPPDLFFSDRHPVSVATRVSARTMLVVVAAGNEGRTPDVDTLSPLARLPWTIVVGAAADAEGSSLHDCSAAGLPGCRGVDVVADGKDPFVSEWAPDGRQILLSGLVAERAPATDGTSFAVPRVVRQLCCLWGFWYSVFNSSLALDDRPPEGIPLPATFHLDWGQNVGHAPTVPALPLNAIDRDSLAKARMCWKRHTRNTLYSLPTLETVTTLLFSSAQPLPDYGRHEVGHGFISDATTIEFLRSMSALEYLRMLNADLVASLSHRDVRELGKAPLLTATAIHDLQAIWSRDGVLSWYFDLAKNQISGAWLCAEHATDSDAATHRSWRDERVWPPLGEEHA